MVRGDTNHDYFIRSQRLRLINESVERCANSTDSSKYERLVAALNLVLLSLCLTRDDILEEDLAPIPDAASR